MKINFPIIAIGASAGGLEPLEQFFENAASLAGYAFVIIQHLAPNHKSLMDELLSRHTNLPIKIIEDKMSLEKGHIYLNPPKYFVEIKNGHFVLSKKEDRKLSFPISNFFSSLAEYHLENTCAIILSGTGSDGTDGVKFVKEKGGLVLVQNPTDAKFNGMPNSAINTGLVDYICSVDEMHVEITNFFRNMNILDSDKIHDDTKKQLTTKILIHIQQHINVDFRGYKYTTVSRRVSRRMSLLSFNRLENYYDYLVNSPNEAHLLAKELLIGVTRFFRDELAFEDLREKVIPKLIENNKETKTIRVWVPACSTGEEAYSIAILIKDYLRRNKLQYEVSIFATDLDKEAIKSAGNRLFSENISAEIPPEYLNTYFTSQRNGYAIAKEIREMIVFSVHNVIHNPPFNKIDLVSCRNFLIYVDDVIQQQVFQIFQYALKTGGFLFLGSSENLGDANEEFIEIDKKSKIYINKESKKFAQRSQLVRRNTYNNSTTTTTAPVNFPIQTNKNKLLNEIQHSLIQEYVPDSIVVDQFFNLIHTSGNAHRWIKLPSGQVSSNFLKMIPEEIALPLEIVANKVFTTAKPVSLTDIDIPQELQLYFNNQKFLNINIRKKELFADNAFLFITFESKSVLSGENNFEHISISSASKERIDILERELRVNRENLQTTVEELESSNEELQAANEELQSSNEELESVNEELYTVNAEYQQKNHELSVANDDLNNLIQSTEIALLFLDANLNVRKFTPAINKILDLVTHDIGRHISHFRSKIQLENFMVHVEKVLDTLVPHESNIKDVKERDYLLRISPFRTNKNEIQGVVLTFIDLIQANKFKNELAISEDALEKMEYSHESQSEVFRFITNNLRDMVCIIDEYGRIEYSSPSGQDITGYPLEKLYHMNLFSNIILNKHKDLWKNALRQVQNDQNSGILQFKFKQYNDRVRWLEASIKNITHENTSSKKFLITLRDIHDRKIREDEFNKLSLIAEQTNSAVLITDIEGKISFVNDAFERMTSYMEEEVLGKKPGDFLQGAESDPEMIKKMAKAIYNKNGFDVNIINYNKFGDKYLVNIKAEPLFNKEEEFIGFFSLQNDITKQEDQLNHIHILNAKIQEQYQKLQEVNKSLDEFAYIASHDLKAPVRNIVGLLEIISNDGNKLDNTQQNEYLNYIIKSSKELSKLIDNLLEYARTGILNEELEKLDFNKLIIDVLQQFNNQIKLHEIQVDLNIEFTEITVYPILFKRLLTNLISNAIKYRNSDHPKITLSCSQRDSEIEFKVADNGIGIPENHFDNIFKIFSSLKPNDDSNGIGLSICKKIVELHGGSIWVNSKLGIGSDFIFTIPKQPT